MQLLVRQELKGFPALALVQLAVSDDQIDSLIRDSLIGGLLFQAQSHTQPGRHGGALAQRSRRRVHARGLQPVRMGGQPRSSFIQGIEPFLIKKAMQGVPPDATAILLSHQVKYSRDYAKYPIALQLSGHTHGGQIFGMHWLAQIINKGFVKDKYQIGDMLLYVNRGTGLWYGFPVRLGIPSEITLVTLKREN